MGSPYFFLSLSLVLPIPLVLTIPLLLLFPLLLPRLGILAAPRAGLPGRFRRRRRRRPAWVPSPRAAARRAGNFPRRRLLVPAERMRPDVPPAPPRAGRPVRGPGAEGGAQIAPRAAGGRAGAARAVSVRVAGGPDPVPGGRVGGDREPLAPAPRRDVRGPGVSDGARSRRPCPGSLPTGRPAGVAAFRVPAAHPPLSSRPAASLP